jgi:hypothetical protein
MQAKLIYKGNKKAAKYFFCEENGRKTTAYDKYWIFTRNKVKYKIQNQSMNNYSTYY